LQGPGGGWDSKGRVWCKWVGLLRVDVEKRVGEGGNGNFNTFTLHLKTTSKSENCETLQPFCFFFALACPAISSKRITLKGDVS